MAKINVAKAIDTIKEEGFNPNPYWGYKCNRGLWLTRFPLTLMPKSPSFMMAFVNAGGNLDAMGHYGFTPEDIKKFEDQRWSLYEIELLAKGVLANLCQVAGIHENNWRIYQRGLDRAEILKKNQIKFSCSTWTLGSKPVAWLIKKIFSKGINYAGTSAYQLVFNYGIEYRKAQEVSPKYGANYILKEALIIEGIVYWNVDEIIPRGMINHYNNCLSKKEVKKERVDSYQSNLRINHFTGEMSRKRYNKIFSCERSARIFASLAKGWFPKVKKGEYHFPSVSTSVGIVYQLHERILMKWNKEEEKLSSLHKMRTVNEYNVCNIAGTWFVWKEDFSKHFEGKGSLRDVLALAERRQKKNSLILTLNDVRNDHPGTAGFCLSGVKGFLQNRLPHLYRLVANYKFWGEIPEELMSTEWALASKEIFSGYPSPVSLSHCDY